MHKFIFQLAIAAITLPALAETPLETINYERALAKVLTGDPIMAQFELQLEAVEGRVEQAGLRPNPVIKAEVENFLGTGPFQSAQAMDLTLGISQTIERGNKRDKRQELAKTKRELILWDREEYLADIKAKVKDAVVDILLAQKRVMLYQDHLDLSQERLQETERLWREGRIAVEEYTRSQLSLQQVELSLKQAERKRLRASVQLSALWGEPTVKELHVVDEVSIEEEIPGFEKLTELIKQNAKWVRWESERDQRQARVALESAQAKGDVSIFGGARYFNEGEGEGALVFGVEIPWPLHDRNQGNIREARSQLHSLEFEREEIQRELMARLSIAYHDLVTAQEEVEMIQTELIPAAEKTQQAMVKGYQSGRFNQLSVLESTATLLELREAHLNALSNYANAQILIQSLIPNL